ncbi:MAG: hypothetical protein COA96_17810 [SAR86 cluster bacterium]|uniref:DUF454 domain-containing protein n=1 Tax=SAR86 cluster bacterium TaxID=2030880 RepID=A0A2A5AF55_9GAMM|nr:MAG: hypothetical protein COA96_17810 [SAR86 cluster bacterium]
MLTSIKNGLLITAGTVSLLLGIIGIFLPVLPTVPFVLLASFCFARSSKRVHSLLIKNPHFGSIIENYESGRGVPRRVKVRAVVLLWLGMGFSCWIVGIPMLCLMLAVIGIGVTAYLYQLPEYLPVEVVEAAENRDSKKPAEPFD